MLVYQVILGLFSVISAFIIFILDRLNNRDNRRKFYGFYARDIKKYFGFFTLISSLAVLMLQTSKEVQQSNIERKEAERKDSLDRARDSIRLDNFSTTVLTIAKNQALLFVEHRNIKILLHIFIVYLQSLLSQNFYISENKNKIR